MNDSFDVGSSNGVSNVGKLLPSLSLDDEDDEYDKSLNNMTNDIDKLVRDADKQLTNLNHNHEGNEKTYLSSSEEGSSEEGSDDDNEGRDTEAADLVANTLAECRLLLDMSPPPTPVGYQEEVQRRKERDTGVEKKKEKAPPPMQSEKIKTVLHHYPKQKEEAAVKDPPVPAVSRRSSQEISDVSITKTYTTSSSVNNNSIQPSLSSIAKFLTCPTCNQEFSEEFDNAMPLHSFACDHIICRGCVFANNAASTNNEGCSTAVACPDCGEANAFDTCRPVVSRAYLNLITKMKSVGSIKSSSVNNDDNDDMKEERRVRVDNNKGRISDRRGGGGTVPTQISVPSPRVDRQANQDRTESRGGGDMNEDTSSVVSNDFSKSSLTLSTTRRLHKPLPTLAIETGEKSAPSIPTLEVISSTPKVKETLATTDMAKEPITPVSRAEYRFLQRKEKLAQSLEKVNRILERSKANKQQVEDRVVQHSQEKVSVYQNMTLSQVQEDENRDVEDIVETHEEVVRDMVPGYHKVEVRRAPSGLEQQNQTSITGRRNVELRVDTGPKSTTALKARRNKAEELDISAYPVQNDTVDIFRTTNYDDTAPQLIEFGTHFIGQTFSNGSSLTDMDTLFLLGGGKKSPATCTASVQSNNKFSSPFKKDRLNNIMKSSPMKSRGHLNSIMKSSRSSQSLSNMDNDDDQQEQEPDVCPQFLPSLTYATMDDECNEVAGLIAMSPHNKDYNNPPQTMWGVGSRSVASADQCGSVLTSMTGSSKVRGKRSGRFLKHLTSRNESTFPRPVVDDMQNNGNGNNGMLQNNEKEQEAPTYDFVSHSCSMSPSSYCDDENKQISQLSGSGLVTHKPKTLHKKLLNTFRRGGKKKTTR